MEILQQLEELFLQAVPTVVIVFLFYFFMRWAFFTPIQKALAERSARIEGAREEAAEVEAAAKKEFAGYQQALKEARARIYAEQEAARQTVLDERARLLKSMRARTQEAVDAAKKKMAADFAAGRAEIERESPALANQIVRVILERPSRLQGGARP